MFLPKRHLAAATPLVLLVEDEVFVRLNQAEVLEDAGYRVVEATNADEALRLLEQRGDEVTVLFTDVRMPGPMDGLALAALAHQRWPHLRLVVTSGHAVYADADLPGAGRFIPKPHRPEALLQIIGDLMSLAR